MPRKRDYEPFDAAKARSCKEHKGRRAKITGLCAGCLQRHLERGNFTWRDERTALIPSVWLSEASGREDSLNVTQDIGEGIPEAYAGLQCVLVCGSREWTDRLAIWDELFTRRNQVEIIIHGAARGADTLAGEVARELGLAVREYPADWERYRSPDPEKGNPAGHIRNAQMLREGQPDLVLAFGEGRGTDGMVKLAEKAGVEVVRVGQRKRPTEAGLSLVVSEG